MSSLAAIHVAKKGLRLDDETYRAVLRRVTGRDSAKDLSEGQRGKVLEEFRRLGWAPFPAKSSRRKLTGKYAGKLQALWIAGWNLAIVREKDDHALLAFLERQTKISDTRFLRYPDDAAKAIEALKAWLAREGGVDWRMRSHVPGYLLCDGYRVALAQWRTLTNARVEAHADERAAFHAEVLRLTGRGSIELTEDREWIPVMNALGERVRVLRQAQDKAGAS